VASCYDTPAYIPQSRNASDSLSVFFSLHL
jgi:hypothetical protein